ncbi:MAG: hypothetical protein ABSG67_04460 [Thermoguttaceae bacterium]|jgi:hypothetical protein
MKTWARYLLTVAAATGVSFAAIIAARAETCALEIKKLESRTIFNPLDNLYRATNSQSFNAQIGPQGKSRISFGREADQQADKFKQIVKKEPKYESDHPFRGVVKFGSQEYAFALDEAIPESEKKAKSEEKDAKSENSDAKPDTKDAKSQAGKSLAGTLLQALTGSDQVDVANQPKAIHYNRLYFDINHNGDLTDDKVIEAETMPGVVYGGSYARFQFPRVDLTIDVDGTPVDYAFLLTGYANSSRDFSYAGVQFNSAAYREGEITLDGKKRHVVLIDNNSNGRFDDENKISKNITRSGGALYPEQGDMLLIDPNQGATGYASPYEASSNNYQHYVSKMVDIDGSYYNLKVSPAGDKLTLEPASVALGKITNPNGHFNAVIYNDDAFLKIIGDKDTPISIPEGEWKLLSYTIDLTNVPEPSKPEEKKDEAKDNSGVSALGLVLESLLGNSSSVAPSGRHFSYVTAGATAKYKPVKVSEGETVEFPFGPPYKPVVSVGYIQGGGENKQASLAMTLFGSTGEVVSDMMVRGARPGKPEFTIKDPKGEVVQSGNFEYG